jgi:hypothetical protein
MDQAYELLTSIAPTSKFFIHMAAPPYLAGINATTPRVNEISLGPIEKTVSLVSSVAI